MFSRRNLILALIAIAALTAGGLYVWQQQQAAAAAAVEIRQETVARGTIVSTVSATGPLAAEAEVNLFFEVAAPVPVAEVAIALGDVVQAGDVLARLDTTDQTLAVRQAEQSLRSAELALAQLTAAPRPEDVAVAEANLRLARAQVYQASRGSTPEQVEIARLNLVVAQRQLDQLNQRMDDLVEQDRFAEKQALEGQQDQLIQAAKVAQLRYEQAQRAGGSGGSALSAVEQAEIALERLQRGPDPDDVRIAQLQVEQAQAALEQARNRLQDAEIVAPFDGVAASVNVRAGEAAAGALPAVVLVDVSRFHIDVAVDEVDISRVAPGQAVTVTVDALPNDVFVGAVDRIAPQSTVNAGVVSYLVRVRVQDEDVRLRAGLTATAEIVVEVAREVALAPNWAIRRDRTTGQAFASVLRDGAIVEVPVRLGLRNETFSEVVDGLSVGDVVAVSTARATFSFFGGQ
jgi:HlyD family secretion protein